MPRVLLVEDDPSVREGVEIGLCQRGHEVHAVMTGEAGLEALGAFRPDILLLDLMLPAMSGVQVCSRVRRTSQLPIIMLTARGDDVDIVVGLEKPARTTTSSSPPEPGSSRPAYVPCCAAPRARSTQGPPSSTTVNSTSTAPVTPSTGRATRSPSRPPN